MSTQPDTIAKVRKVSFDLCRVTPAAFLLKEKPYREAVEACLRGPVEGSSKHASALVPTGIHGFMATVHAAFNDHRPLVISPDHIWLLIAQGFAAHIRANAEKMRHLFVEHEGKKKIEIVRDDIRKGQIDAPWDDAVGDFSQQIQNHLLTDLYTLLTPRFSTTTPVEKTAFEIVLMDAVQDYFELLMSLCGIPTITLEGSPDDWRMIQERIRQFDNYELGWWRKMLDPVLSELVRTAEGHINKKFWEDFYKIHNESGGPYIDGWVIKFFPYMETYTGIGKDAKRTYEINRFIDHVPQTPWDRFSTSMLTSGLSRVPFNWDYGNTIYKMEFVAGFMGMTQDGKTKALRPEIGWAVQDVEAVKTFRSTHQQPGFPDGF